MSFLLDTVVPLLIAGIAVGIISYLLNVILRAIGLDVSIIKLGLFFLVWYFVGPIIYEFLLSNLITHQNEIMRFIYEPVQMIMEVLKI